MNPTDLDLFKYSIGEVGGRLYENFYPVEHENFVILCNDEDYQYWDELIEMIAPILNHYNIGLYSISIYGEPPLPCRQFTEVNVRHYSHLIDKANVVIGGWAANQKKEDGINCAATLPEEIANKILLKLGINHPITIKTLEAGPSYGIHSIDLIPNFTFTPRNTIPRHVPVSIRCDLFENWKFVIDMSNHDYRTFLTINQEIPIPVLPFIKNIKKINIYISDKFSVEAIDRIQKSGIPYSLLFEEGSGNLNDLKMKFFDYNPISLIKNWGKNNLDKLNLLPQTTHLKSSRILVCREGNFTSLFHLKRGIQVNDPRGTQIMDGANDEDFLKEADMFTYFSK